VTARGLCRLYPPPCVAAGSGKLTLLRCSEHCRRRLNPRTSSENSNVHVEEGQHELHQDDNVTQSSEAAAADEHHLWGVSPPQIIQGDGVDGVLTQDQAKVTVPQPPHGQDQSGSLPGECDTEAVLLLNLEQDSRVNQDKGARLKKESQREGQEVSGSTDKEEEEAMQDRKEKGPAEEPDRQKEAQQEAQENDSVQQAAKTSRKLRLFKPGPPSQETHALQTVKAPAPRPTQSVGSADPKRKSPVPLPVPQLTLPDSEASCAAATRETASKARFEFF
jgi:hypothetical protein